MKRVYAISGLVIIVLLNLLLISCDTTEPQPTDFHNKILFTSSRTGKPQLYMMNPDGSGIRQITSGNYWHSDGKWSSDAKQIICNTEENSTTAGSSMVVMNVDGSNRKLLGYGNFTLVVLKNYTHSACWDAGFGIIVVGQKFITRMLPYTECME
jgi:hypothetical protein